MTAAIAGVDGWDGHMSWGGGWWMFSWGTLMMAGLIVLLVWLVRSLGGGGSAGAGTADPLDPARRILAERFARGEPTTEEYRERLAQLV